MIKKAISIPNFDARGTTILSIGFGLYSILVICLSAYGVFAAVETNLFGATVVAAMVSLVSFYFLSSSVRAWASKLGPYGLAGFHVWRIPAALTFLYYGSQGLLPDTYSGPQKLDR